MPFVKQCVRKEVRSAQAARTPGQAAAGATRTARAPNAGNDPDATETAAAAPAAAATPATHVAATATAEATATTTATATMAPATTASARHLHAAGANAFLVEEIERGETDVGHLLLAKNEALIERAVVRLWDISGGHRGCGCATCQRKTQSGGTQHFHGGGFAQAFLRRSQLDP